MSRTAARTPEEKIAYARGYQRGRSGLPPHSFDFRKLPAHTLGRVYERFKNAMDSLDDFAGALLQEDWDADFLGMKTAVLACRELIGEMEQLVIESAGECYGDYGQPLGDRRFRSP